MIVGNICCSAASHVDWVLWLRDAFTSDLLHHLQICFINTVTTVANQLAYAWHCCRSHICTLKLLTLQKITHEPGQQRCQSHSSPCYLLCQYLRLMLDTLGLHICTCEVLCSILFWPQELHVSLWRLLSCLKFCTIHTQRSVLIDTWICIERDNAKKLLKELHLHDVMTHHTTIKLRRKLENTKMSKTTKQRQCTTQVFDPH